MAKPPAVKVRDADMSDRAELLMMRRRLWPSSHDDHSGEVDRFFQHRHKEREVFIAEMGEEIVGFIELAVRNYAEGCTTDRVLYMEGLFVKAIARRRGVGRALLDAAEAWGQALGCREFASDTMLDDQDGVTAHEQLGFEEVGALRCFKKML